MRKESRSCYWGHSEYSWLLLFPRSFFSPQDSIRLCSWKTTLIAAPFLSPTRCLQTTQLVIPLFFFLRNKFKLSHIIYQCFLLGQWEQFLRKWELNWGGCQQGLPQAWFFAWAGAVVPGEVALFLVSPVGTQEHYQDGALSCIWDLAQRWRCRIQPWL